MLNFNVVFMPHPPVIIPEIGDGKESSCKDTILGMDRLGQLVGKLKPQTIIFVTPHGNSFNNGTCILNKQNINGDFSAYGSPQVVFKKQTNVKLANDIFNMFEKSDFVSILLDEELAKNYCVDITLDNGVMVPMYFIDKYHSNYDIVHITPGFTSLKENYCLGQKIQEVIKERNESVLIVCSGDLSHALKNEGPYDFHPSGPAFDLMVKKAIIDKNPLSLITLDKKFLEEAGQCGIRSFLMGFGFLDAIAYDSKIFSYEGPFGVGYLTGYLSSNDGLKELSLLPDLLNLSMNIYREKIYNEDDYIKLARLSIENYVNSERKLDLETVRNEFSKDFIKETQSKKAGVFVSIYKHDELRGCIGTISPVQDDIAEEIIYNSISACNDDPRFDSVESNELLELDIKVDILMEPEMIYSKEELDIIKYGVIVEKGSRRGLLLPNLEGIDTVEEQVQIAMNKAGIINELGMKLYRFRVNRHERLYH
ncbi:AmmeMemoRadiSam system protein A [Alkalibaculum sp. M08DMB]|uniref:AmmeMemoRadiSam system protein A n=1 Tax=Alkalibaculum sporogenes TaxID=2655001 RepID=A0A6A7K506_9FIRM|nr:AmmeMemoRadiSam system protein A [Alkalibaculum sporogenes]MPW24549.1 AmmeMemoRadiSam system protein A [Alkalibaculum sporogenes]